MSSLPKMTIEKPTKALKRVVSPFVFRRCCRRRGIFGAGEKKSRKQLKKVAKQIPGGKKTLKAISSNVPLLKQESDESLGRNGEKKGKRVDRSK